jgi:hypothetical protein
VYYQNQKAFELSGEAVDPFISFVSLCAVTRCGPEQFGFKTTKELAPMEETFGQVRALAAVQFGVGIEREGYNLFCLGPTGIGKHSFIRQFLEEKAVSSLP